ncbi:MAG: hypothetical protein EXR05_10510 [Acetobacteraceae bacterium]|nr:hypothetical protein [Acetobacteraceae bacterium]
MIIAYPPALRFTLCSALEALLGLSLGSGAAARDAPKGARVLAFVPVQLAQATPPAAPGQIPSAAPRLARAPAAAEAVIQPVDLSPYSWQDLMTGMLNKQMERIGMTVASSWDLARAKEDLTNALLDFAHIKPLNEAM